MIPRYMISTLLVKYIMAGTCTVVELRTVSCLALIALFFACHGCKGLIMAGKNDEHEATIKVNWDAIHTAFNICLFPPLFFFSGLYYTDVVSTCIVIGAYYRFLNGGGNSSTSIFTRPSICVWGILALLMRQTNIFWVAVFFGGLETVRTFKTGSHGLVWKGGASEPIHRLLESIKLFSHGELHDPPLQDASVFGTQVPLTWKLN
jgi:alpha-1,2-glucosyltransferase